MNSEIDELLRESAPSLPYSRFDEFFQEAYISNDEIDIMGYITKINTSNGYLELSVKTDDTIRHLFGTNPDYPVDVNDLVWTKAYEKEINGLPYYFCNFITARSKPDATVYIQKHFRNEGAVAKMLQVCCMFGFKNLNDLLDQMTQVRDPVHYSNLIFNNAVFVRTIKNLCDEWYQVNFVRPLKLLELTDKQIEEIPLDLKEAYKIIVDNPYHFPWIDEYTACDICTKHLYRQPEEEEIYYHSIARFLVNMNTSDRHVGYPAYLMEAKFKKIEEDKLGAFYIVKDTDFYYLKNVYQAEIRIAQLLKHLAEQPRVKSYKLEFSPDSKLDSHQIDGIVKVFESRIVIITGEGGTGKTEMIKSIVENALSNGDKVLCTAFVGIAVARMREKIKNLCEVQTMDYAILADIDADLIIIDEASMVSTELFYRFIKKNMRKTCSFVFVGDVEQLQPITWGSLFLNLLKLEKKEDGSGVVPVHRLYTNYRSNNDILKICRSIIDKERIRNKNNIDWTSENEHYHFFKTDDIVAKATQVVKAKLESGVKRKDITVVAPYVVDKNALNLSLQAIYQPANTIKTIDGRKWAVNDRIVNCKTIYPIRVFNGELGFIESISETYIVCRFGSTVWPFFCESLANSLYKAYWRKNYSNEHEKLFEIFPSLKTLLPEALCYMKNVDLAYCLTVHKAQGSQYPHTIVCLQKFTNFIDIPMLYTACSRAQDDLTVITTDLDGLNISSFRGAKKPFDNLAKRLGYEETSCDNYFDGDVCGDDDDDNFDDFYNSDIY